MNDLAKRIAALSPEQRVLFELRLKQKGLNARQAQSIPKRKASDALPLSLAQERLWVLHQLQPDIPLYNESILFRLTGKLNRVALEQSLNEIIRRHEILRTCFQVVEGQPMQVIAPTLTLTLPVVDLQEIRSTEQEAKVKQVATQDSSHPFDLTRGPLLRGTLLRLREKEHVMLLTMHHIISDGWSWKVFFQELAALYQAFCNRSPSPLPQLPIQYADFALWQRQWLEGKGLSTQLTYWKQQLDAAPPVLGLPTDYPRPAVQTFRGARETLILPQPLTGALKSLSQQEGVTLFMLLLAAFKTLLYRYTRQDDILVGTPIANRTQIETESLIGCFVNTLVLRTDLSSNPSFRELLDRVREVTLGAFAHQVPFEQLVKELQPQRVLSHNPLFQVMFVFQDAPLLALDLPGLTLQPLIVDSGIAKFDLTLFLEDTKQGLIGALEYNTDLFDTGTITRMLGHFQTLLEGIAAAPDQCLNDLPLLTAEQHQLMVEWNDTTIDYPQDRCIHELFEAQVEQTPDAVALVFEDQQLTYRQINQRANQLAHYLRRLLTEAKPSLGVESEVLVGICMERSLLMVVGLLGILKAGGAYVPLDPEYPPERLAFMLEDAQVPVLLTQQKLLDDGRLTINNQQSAVNTHPIVVCLDTDWEAIRLSISAQATQENPGSLAQNLSSTVNPENLAYVIYTSGSTGLPKGTMNTHRGLSNRLHWMQQAYQLTPADRVLQKTPFSFDVSVWEFFWPLLNGACLVMAQPGGHQDCAYLVKLIVQQQITTLHFVPSMLQVFIEEPGVKACSSLRRVICSGEALPWELQQRFFTCLNAELHNLYGPTEAAIDVTFWACQRHSDLNIVPIGRPIANTQIYLLDDHLQPVPIGVPGELHIGGVGLARGYLNRPDLTAEKFIANPFGQSPGVPSYPQARLYKTGDLARYRQDGSIEFLGRIDHQVKLRGFRIELAEIEAVLGKHPAVRETVVMVREDEPGDKRLVAYVVSYPELAIAVSTLRNYLQEKLPAYMVPSAFLLIDALPLTTNGKVDRRALPALLPARPELEETFVAPSTPVEELLTGIWAQILGIERVGIHDNFFELGGHSLLATQVISHLGKAFQVELPLRRLFEAPTVFSLAEQIEMAIKAKPGLTPWPIERVSRQVELPLSFAQQRLWFLHQLDPGSSAYNGPAAVLLQGSLNVAALEQSINEIVRRHEALRTCFPVVEGRPVQKIVSALSVSLPVVDLQDLPETKREAEVQRLGRSNTQQPFDLAQAPLLRLTLLRLSTQEHVLLLTMHHIISDAWSAGVFIREVAALYEAFSTGKLLPLPELPIQYADFAVWQQQWLQGEVLDTQLNYWKQQLNGAKTVLELPTDRPRSHVQTSTGTKHSFALSPSLSHTLKSLSQQEGVTLFMTLLAAFNTLLYRYTGQEDILVGSPIANRNRSQTERLIGFFANTLVLRTDLSRDPSFRELMRRVREVALGAYAHQELPFEKLVAELQPERNLGYAPLFQVWFVLQNAPMPALKLSGLTLSFLEAESGMVRHDLKLDLLETPEGLKGFLEYKTDLFDATTIARMAGALETLLATVVEQPDIQLSQVAEILDEAEKQQQILKNQEFKQARRQKLGKIGRQPITGINE